MKNFLSIIIFFLTLTSTVYAGCDFERVKLGTGSETVKSTYGTEIIKDPNNFSLSSSPSKGVNGTQVCSDKQFESLKFNFSFINHKLELISVTDNGNSIDHLQNLSAYYGRPTYENVSALKKGTDDYHWELKNKNVFLQVVRDNGFYVKNIKIISKNYTSLLQTFIKSDDVLH